VAGQGDQDHMINIPGSAGDSVICVCVCIQGNSKTSCRQIWT